MKPELLTAIIISILIGMLMAFGIVLVFEFYASGTEHPTLYSILTIL